MSDESARCSWSSRIGYDCELSEGHKGDHVATDIDGKSKVGWASDHRSAYQRLPKLRIFGVDDDGAYHPPDREWWVANLAALTAARAEADALRARCEGLEKIVRKALNPTYEGELHEAAAKLGVLP